MSILSNIDVFCENFNVCGSMESITKNGGVPSYQEVEKRLLDNGWSFDGIKAKCPKCRRVKA